MNYSNVGAKLENNEVIQLVYTQQQTNQLCLIMILLLQSWVESSVLMFTGLFSALKKMWRMSTYLFKLKVKNSKIDKQRKIIIINQAGEEKINSNNTTLLIKLYLQNNNLPCSECRSFKLIKLVY